MQAIDPLAWPQLGTRLANAGAFLKLLAALRRLAEPLTTPDGLRQALDLLVRVGEFLGVEQSWLDRLRHILGNDEVFALVLLVVQFASGWSHHLPGDHTLRVAGEDGRLYAIQAQHVLEWLPLVLEILALLRQLRGAA